MSPAMSGWLPLAAALLLGAALFEFSQAVFRGVRTDERSRQRLEAIASSPEGLGGAADARAHQRRRSLGTEGIEGDLRRAGLAWTATDYAVITALTGIIVGGLTFVVSGSVPVTAVAALSGVAAPTVFVRSRSASRTAKFNAQVVETIELISSSLRSGFGFMQSLELASREQPPPIADELRQVAHEVDLGVSVDDALERLAARTRDEDLELVVQAVLVQRRVGGDLGDVLGRIAGMIRDRIRVRGEIQTLTAQARMSAWIVGMLPVALAGVTAFLQPDQIAVLFTEPIGQLLVAVAAVLQVVGFLLVRRMAQIAY